MRTGLAAAALIICISMGYMACSRMRDRVDKLNALCAEIRTLGDSMELSQYRLSEMLDRLGGANTLRRLRGNSVVRAKHGQLRYKRKRTAAA